MKIIVAGDFCPQDRVATLLGTPSQENILKDITPIVRNSDIAVLNLECPLLYTDEHPITKQGPNLKSKSKSIDIIKKSGFNIVTLANNHILDYGEKGLEQTINILDKANIQHVGAGMNLQDASQIYYYEKKGIQIAIINCCEHEFSIASENTAGANPLNPIKQWHAIKEAKQQADYVIVIVHGGHEHFSLPSPRMQETYRFFVDSGADAVINHHQHCYSGYEIYKEKPIFYGLGNFCFDWTGKRDSAWNYGYMVELCLAAKISFTIFPYEQCDQTPNVVLLRGEQRSKIEEEIKRLNTIISAPQKLKIEHEKWMNKEERDWLISLTPITNRYIQALIRHKILPLYLPQKKIIALLNKVACESHRDKLIHILKKQL